MANPTTRCVVKSDNYRKESLLWAVDMFFKRTRILGTILFIVSNVEFLVVVKLWKFIKVKYVDNSCQTAKPVS